MIFSYEIYEHRPGQQIWSDIERLLPEGYAAPDLDFLQGLGPMLLEPYMESKSMLVPGRWDGHEDFWRYAKAHLPEAYSVPDLTLLRLVLEVR